MSRGTHAAAGAPPLAAVMSIGAAPAYADVGGGPSLGVAVVVLVLAGIVVVVETTNAKLRLFRVPDLLSAAFVLAGLALFSTFLFQ